MTNFTGQLGTKTLGARMKPTPALAALLKQLNGGTRVVLQPGGAGPAAGEDQGPPLLLFNPATDAEQVAAAVGGVEAARALKAVYAEPFIACRLREHQREGVR